MTIPPESDLARPEHDLNLLAAYVEGRLEVGERARITTHLAACPECRATLAELARSGEDQEAARPIEPRWSVNRWLPLAAVLVAGAIVGVKTLQAPSPTTIPPEGPKPPVPAPKSAAAPEADASPPVAPDPSVTRVTPVPSTPSAAPLAPSEDVLVKRGGVRRSVDGKTFRLVAGEWVDVTFDPGAGLPVVEARSPAERRGVLDRIPALVPFADLGPRVVVVKDGVVYRFGSRSSR